MDLDLGDLCSFSEQVLEWIGAFTGRSDGNALSAERKPYETCGIKRGNRSAKENARLDVKGIRGGECNKSCSFGSWP